MKNSLKVNSLIKFVFHRRTFVAEILIAILDMQIQGKQSRKNERLNSEINCKNLVRFNCHIQNQPVIDSNLFYTE
jgi:hypothetical protein